MPINFIPNDPRAGSTAPALRQTSIRPNRPPSRSRFKLDGRIAEGVAPPFSPQFLFWQAREAGLATLDAWESSAGAHKRWQGNRKSLPLFHDAGEDLNAFYDRMSFSFFHMEVSGETFFSGASTDVVSHEVGHGLLDSIRPDLFGVNALEVGAFHEAFGDCMALLTALSDQDSREKLLAVTPTLRKRNFVETTAEDLSFGIKKLQPGHNAAEPRHAFNKFQFQLPQTLPSTGGPGKLINEEHSFGMIFTGCFWDLIANIFADGNDKTQTGVASAAVAAGTILAAAAKTAVLTSRFFQSVGRAMVLADQRTGGAHRDHIRDAFQAHSIVLGSNAIVAPTMALEGTAPKGGKIADATKVDLMRRLGGAKGATMSLSQSDLFGTPVVAAVQTREIPLSSLDKRLKGVVCEAHESVMVGQSGGRAAVMGLMPHVENTDFEVQEYVKTLLEHDRVDWGKKKGVVADGPATVTTTHAIEQSGSKKVLRRVRFLCRPT